MTEYTLQNFKDDCIVLCDFITASDICGNIKAIYGIPKGGIPVAIRLAGLMNLPLIDYSQLVNYKKNQVLVCDDLIDSGRTLSAFNGFPSAVLCSKGLSDIFDNQFIARLIEPEWVHFWWEDCVQTDIEHTVVRMLEYIGEDPTRPGLLETPKRVVKMWGEVFGGMSKKTRPRIQTVPNGEDDVFYDEMLRDSGYFFSHCEHHLVPFFGDYYFGYIPDKLILGASKIGRLVDYYSARPQIAERLVNQVINDIEKEVKPHGSILVMNARHLCKEMRGLKKWNSPYEAIATRGYFRENTNNCKDEFLARLPKR